MKLAPCPDCLAPCSVFASLCPKCGRPFKAGELVESPPVHPAPPKKKLTAKSIITFLLIAAVIAQMPLTVKWLKPDVQDALRAGEKNADQNLGIGSLIKRVRDELSDSAKARTDAGQPALFRVKDFDLEVHFTVKASSSAKEGVEFQVLTANSESQTDLEKVQKITLHMEGIPDREVVQGPPTNKTPIDADPGEIFKHGDLPAATKKRKP